MSSTVRWNGQTLTKGDLLEFIGEISSAPDTTVINVEKAAFSGHPSDPGGDITLSAELPRARRTPASQDWA